MIVFPKLPSIFELFGIEDFKQVLALDDMFLSGRRDSGILQSVNLYNKKYPNVNNSEEVRSSAELQLEFTSPHFHVTEEKPIVFEYLNNVEGVVDEINDWWFEQLNLDNFDGADIDNWPMYFPEYADFNPFLLDLLGSFNQSRNELSINLKEIKVSAPHEFKFDPNDLTAEDLDINNQEEVCFEENEMINLVIYHNYGHWISKNLNITFTPQDKVFNDNPDFQELFANWFTVCVLNFKGELELLKKLKHYLNSQIKNDQNPFKIYPHTFQPLELEITDPLLLKILLYCGRSTAGSPNEIQPIIDMIQLIESKEEWEQEVFEIKEDYWNERYYNNQYINCIERDIINNVYCSCNFDANPNIDGIFSFQV